MTGVILQQATVISAGSLFGLTTATLTCLMGQPRIFYRMAKDVCLFVFCRCTAATRSCSLTHCCIYGVVQGLLWPWLHRLNDAQIPVVATWTTGILTAVIAFFVSLDVLAQAISIGTLWAFSIVCAGVIVVR